VEKVCLSF